MEVAALGLKVDGVQDIDHAWSSLDRLTKASESAEKAADDLGKSTKDTGDRFKALAQAALDQKAALDAEVRAAIEATNVNRKMTEGWQAQVKAQTDLLSAEHKAREASKQHEAQMKATAAAAERNRQSLQRLLAQIDPLEGKLNKLDDLEKQLHASFNQGAIAADEYGVALSKIYGQRNEVFDRQMKQMSDGAKDAANSIRILGLQSAQSQRDVVSLGRAVTRGDWAQASSSALNLSRSTGLMSSAFAGAAIAAGATAVGVAALVVAWNEGQKEAAEFNKTLVMTGNAAGTSTDQLMTMAARVGDMVGTQRRAAAALNELAQAANIGARDFERFAETALRWEDATGTAASEVVREFEEIGRSPVEAMDRLDRSMNFLTESTRTQIKELVEQGRQIEAANLLQNEYADTLDARAPQMVEHLNVIGRLWREIKTETGKAVNELLNIGRAPTLEAQERILEARLRQAEEFQNIGVSDPTGTVDDLRQRLDYIRGERALRESINSIMQDGIVLQGQRNEAEKNFSAYVDDRMSKEQQRARDQDKETKAYESRLAEQKRLLEAGLVDEATHRNQVERIEAAHQTALKNIRDKYKDKQSGGISTTQTELASLKAAVEAERQREEVLHSLTAARGNLNEHEKKAIQYGEKLKLTSDQKVRAQLKENKALAEQAGAMKRANDAFEKESKERESAIAAAERQTETLRDQIATYGLGKSAIEEMTIARLEERLALADPEISQRHIADLQRELEVRRELLDAMRTKESLDAQLREWQAWEREVDRIFNQLGQSLTDQLFEGGKSARDAIRDLFKNLVLRVAIQPVMGALQGMVTNQLGGLLGLSNPQAGGGVLGMAQNANTLYQAYSGGMASNLGQGAQWLGNKIGSEALRSFGMGLTGSAGAAGTVAGITSVGAGLGASLGASIGTSAAAMTSTTFAASMAGGALIPGLGVGAAGGGVAAGTAGAAAAAGASGAAGFGAAVGAALPWIGGALAVGSLLGGGLFGDRLPTTRRSQQGATGMLPDGSFVITSHDSRQDAASQEAARVFAEQAVKSANDLFAQAGVDAAIYSFQTLMESSILGDRQGVGSSGQVRVGDEIRDIGLTVEPSWTQHGVGGWSEAEMLPRLQADIQLTLLEAFQAAGDQLPSVLSGMLEDVDIRSLGEEQAQALAQSFQAVIDQVSAFQIAVESLPFAQLRDLSFDAAANLISFAGGLEALDQGMTTYFQNFYSEAEQLDFLSSQISGALDELGLTMPDVTQGAQEARAAYRSLVESLDLNTEEGQRAYATLMTLSGGFAELTAGMDQLSGASQSANRSIAQLAQDAYSAAVAQGKAAYSALSRAITREKTRIQRESEAIAEALRNSISAASTTVSELNSLTNRLTSTVQRMVSSGLDDARNREWAQERISRALSVATLTGVMPQGQDFEHALQLVAQPSQGLFDSFEDYQADFLRSAHDVSKLNELAGVQLTTEQRALESLESQLQTSQEWYQAEIARLDGVLEYHRMQLDIATGTYQAELSQIDAIKAVEAAVKNIRIAAANQQKYAPESSVSRGEQYLINNPDVMAQYDVHGGGRTLDEYAKLHYDLYGRWEGRSFDVGTNYVPYDMIAQVHKGEAIIPAYDNRMLMQAVMGGGNRDNELKLVKQELRETRLMLNRLLDEIAQNTYDSSRNTQDIAERGIDVEVKNKVLHTVEAEPGK